MPLVLSVHLWAGKSREGEKVNFNENFLNFLSVDALQHAHSDTSGVLLPSQNTNMVLVGKFPQNIILKISLPN